MNTHDSLTTTGRLVPTGHGIYEVAHADGTIVVQVADAVNLPDVFDVGVYPDGTWHTHGETETIVTIRGTENVAALVRDLTTLQPEGTHWGTWACQWIADADAEDRIWGQCGDRLH